MKSRWLINLALAAAIVVLTLVARYEPGIDAPPRAQTLTPLKTADIQRVHINRPLRDDLVLARTGEHWVIERDPPLAADEFQVRALLRLAEQAVIRSYPVAELELSRLALDPAYASVTLNDTAIDFGSLESLEGLRYARVGDHVHLISDLYQHLVEADYTQFVRRRLFSDTDRIMAISLPGFAISRTDGGWTVSPDRDVSADALQRLADDWQQATAVHVQAAGPVADGGETIVVSLAEPDREIRLRVVAREPELVLARAGSGIQYRLGNLAGRLLTLGDDTARETMPGSVVSEP